MTHLYLIVLIISTSTVHGWPQRRSLQEPVTVPPISVCNVTFVADSRAGRPSSPDPPLDDEAKERINRDEKIIFPGTGDNNKVVSNRDNLDRTRFVPLVQERGPSCAEGSTFCEESDNYPSEYLRTILRYESKVSLEFFVQDIITEANISQRIDVSDETPLCQSLEQVVYPKMAQNKEDKWLFIINQDDYVQGVRVEKCIKEGPCSMTEGFPIGYTTKCRQKYIYRKMLSLNENGNTKSDAFRIPSCCACYYRPNVGMLASRFAANAADTSGRALTGGNHAFSTTTQSITPQVSPRPLPRSTTMNPPKSQVLTSAPRGSNKLTRLP